MPRIYGTVDVLNFDAAGYTRAVTAAIEAEFRQAARAFIRAAIPRIPVQTGMAKGSFLNVGRFLRVAVPIAPTRFNQRYYPPGGGNSIPKTPESGAALSTQPNEMITRVGNRFVFEFSSRVFHLTLEDLIGVHSGPWGAFAAGRAAFMQRMRQLRTRLPRIGEYVTRTSITYGRSSPIRSAPVRLRQQERTGGDG